MDNATLRILLADDDECDRILFNEVFQEMEMKHSIHMVKNGLELMDYLSSGEILLPHFIFLDLNMPFKNGLDCLKEIRADEKFSEILIAVYSTSATEKDIEETFYSGANNYIKKPNTFALLKELLGKAVANATIHQEKSLNKANFLISV
jgi:CheY-like chemotaxis protein